MKRKEIAVGGQAVIEGVMMRGPEKIATAVRRADNSIEVKQEEFISITQKNKFLGLPLVRGFASLIEMMGLGMRTLGFSAQRWELDNEDENTKKKSDKAKKTEEALSYVVAFALAMFLFGFVPYFTAKLLDLDKHNLYFNLVAGFIRIVFFVTYVWLISFMKDVKRLFQYHGAEHKSVYAYEKQDKLNPEKVQKYSTLHPRCGTSFMFFVLLISLFVFTIVDFIVGHVLGSLPHYAVRWMYHILLIPFVSGISYEVLKLSGKNIHHPLVKLMTVPGMAIQRITTQPPSDDQIEVALVALKCALDLDYSEHGDVRELTDEIIEAEQAKKQKAQN